jgi:hypothetical protein
MKVYLEDRANCEMVIQGVPCRKLGNLKNGEEQTFTIGNQEAKVFVIADKLTKNYSGEYYQLPEGQEDLRLTGKNVLNPLVGNPFRFDNNSEDIKTYRKKRALIGLVALVVVCLSSVAGCMVGGALGGAVVDSGNEAKTFSEKGMTITLTDGFKTASVPNYTVAFDSKDVAVFALREPFTMAEGFENYTLSRYADLVIQANKLSGTQVEVTDGLIHFEYDFTNPENQQIYHYYTFVFKAKDAFWMVQFATMKDNAADREGQIFQWAKSITFQ